jgi:CheY-like chemotaxis protein
LRIGNAAGSAALALARKDRPEVAFLDAAMPDMSGAELAQQLRQAFPPTDLALVAVTGHAREGAGTAAVRAAPARQISRMPR